MILTDMGRMFLDTLTKASVSASAYYVPLYIGDNKVTLSELGTYYAMPVSSLSVVNNIIPSLFTPTKTLTLSYGNQLEVESNYWYSGIKKITFLSGGSVTCTTQKDSTTGFTQVNGIISNTSTVQIGVKYLGYEASNITIYNGRSSSASSTSCNFGVLSYIELPEPISIAPGEDYPFKITYQ